MAGVVASLVVARTLVPVVIEAPSVLVPCPEASATVLLAVLAVLTPSVANDLAVVLFPASTPVVIAATVEIADVGRIAPRQGPCLSGVAEGRGREGPTNAAVFIAVVVARSTLDAAGRFIDELFHGR